MKGYRPLEFGEAPPKGSGSTYTINVNGLRVCAYPGCVKFIKMDKSKSGRLSVSGRWCPGHAKQRQRHGPSGMKPLMVRVRRKK